MNTFGNIYRLTTFGESHGAAVGGVIDGCPPRVDIDFEALRMMMNRRRPGQSPVVTPRSESDEVVFLSGVVDDTVTTGTPIAFTIASTNMRSTDYSELAQAFRPSHADYTYQMKYGIRDYRGGGRSSARETAARVVGGAIAKQILASEGISVEAYTLRIGRVAVEGDFVSRCGDNAVYCPDEAAAQAMIGEIEQARSEGDTLGGIVGCTVKGCPAGLGEPIYTKLSAMLASAMMSINAAKGFDYGMGFAGAAARGSEVIDPFDCDVDGEIVTTANNSGGIQGGISNGNDIYMRVAFKPVATMMRPLTSVDTDGRRVTIPPRGRHDVCVVPRAVVVVEAMAAMVILDALMMARATGV